MGCNATTMLQSGDLDLPKVGERSLMRASGVTAGYLPTLPISLSKVSTIMQHSVPTGPIMGDGSERGDCARTRKACGASGVESAGGFRDRGSR